MNFSASSTVPSSVSIILYSIRSKLFLLFPPVFLTFPDFVFLPGCYFLLLFFQPLDRYLFHPCHALQLFLSPVVCFFRTSMLLYWRFSCFRHDTSFRIILLHPPYRRIYAPWLYGYWHWPDRNIHGQCRSCKSVPYFHFLSATINLSFKNSWNSLIIFHPFQIILAICFGQLYFPLRRFLRFPDKSIGYYNLFPIIEKI